MKYLSAYPFSEGLARVQLAAGTTEGTANEFIFIKPDGSSAFSSGYKYAKDFSEGYAACATNDGAWGMIDSDGNVVMDFEWEEIWPVTDGSVRLFDGENYYIAKLK